MHSTLFTSIGVAFALLAGPSIGTAPAAGTVDLQRGFERPPDSARPWVYWFWLNGNISSNGITADLEAMQRAGIGGVLIMEVDQGAPLGPVNFMGGNWRALFKHVVSEAQRLGLEVNMNNDAGWNGSGGPWIKPEQSMQKVVWTETAVQGGQPFSGTLPQPQAVAGYYRDLAVLAFPTPGAFRIDNIKVKACYQAAFVGSGTYSNLPPEMVTRRDRLVDLTSRIAPDGRLNWDPPAGHWTVLRLGHTSTGVENAPSPASGRGLECDKLSDEGIRANFDGMMGKLIRDVGPDAGRTLAATHIDSWENGAQNWTARMRQEFQARRGYDLLLFLPVFTGRVVDSLEISERFLWDLRKTVSELVVEKYAGGLQRLAHEHGMRLSIEAYGGPCEDLPYAGRADEPMCEFWMGGGAFNTVKGMASAAHTYGKRILGAESFTAADQEKWLDHPGSIKSLGDRAFCEGVSRFVFHRYAMQPWREERRPGMTMGPWGLHYERTQTWWEWSRAWHEYLARCQFLLRQGLFVADLCYLQPEAAPQDFQAHSAAGYDYDEASAEVVLTRMSVKDGRLLLPDGMSYRVLVLADSRTMSPALLRKLTELVRAGATIIGPRPLKSPSLAGYPDCDAEVNRLASELWGTCDGATVKERQLGDGRVVWGIAPESVLAQMKVQADFTSRPHLRYIHRADADTDLYFVANPKSQEVEATCTFRVSGKTPELWWPDSGRIEPAAVFEQNNGMTSVSLRLEPSGSVFVVFRPGSSQLDGVTTVERDAKTIWPVAGRTGRITVRKASYGVLSDPARTRDVRAVVQQLVENGEESFDVTQLVRSGDPAPNVVKSVLIEYAVGGQETITVTGRDRERIFLPEYAPKVVIQKAVYGVPGDAKRTRDVRSKLQHLVDAGEFTFSVARMAEGDDPAFLVIKTLSVDYTLNGKPISIQGTDPETLSLAVPPVTPADRIADVHRDGSQKLVLIAWKPGEYEVRTSAGHAQTLNVPVVPTPVTVAGPWQVRFAPGGGAPENMSFDSLLDWSKHTDPGVKFYGGSATYRRTFTLPSQLMGADRQWTLDLGKVAIMARVRLNGKDLGTLWKAPYAVDITQAVQPGENSLEVAVVNLWVNRMIGDEALPEDSERNPDGTLKRWPDWLQAGQPSPTGRYTFTSWRLWKKDSPLQESGLIGPVTLHTAVRVPVAVSP
jgi:hypothetical protein